MAVDAPEAAPAAPPAAVGRAKLTNPRKVLYPLTGTTKSDVLAYYLAVADVMLPHLRDRPVTMVRWPDGVEKPSFFEKDVSRHAPSWIRTERVGTPGGRSEHADFPFIESAQGLAWAANLAALELHVPQWRVGPRGGRHNPDLVVFDLDPGEGTTVVDCARVAERLAERLAADGLSCWPRTSGGKGMQLYLPVTVSTPERTSEYAKALAEELAAGDAAARHRRDGEGPPPRPGVRGLEPEQPVQDHDRELLAARPGPADRRDPGHVGRGARGHPPRGPGVHRRRPARRGSPSTATSSPRCWATPSACPR